MSISRKNVFLNLFWSSTSFLTGIVRTLFLMPVFLSNWDKQLYGFWFLIFYFYSITLYVIEGYSRYTINEYSKLFFKDKLQAYKYFGSGLRVLLLFSIASVLLLSCIVQFSYPMEKLFSVSREVINAESLQYALLSIFLLAAIHSLTKYLAYAILPHGKIYVPERFVAVYVIVEALVWLVAATGLFTLFQCFLIYVVILSLVCIGFLVIVARKYAYYKIIFYRGNIKDGLKDVIRPSFFIINNFCEKFTVEGLVFVVSVLFSALMVPVYSAIRTMANLIVTGTNMVVATFIIEYQKHSVNRDGRALLNLFNATWLLVGFIVNYGLVIFLPFLPAIFRLWTKNELEFDLVFFNYMLCASIFIVYGSNIITYLKSVNKVKQVFIVAVVRAVLLLTLILVFPKALVYIGLSLLIAEFLVNMILLNAFLYYELGGMQTGAVVSKILWNMVPFLITALYILTNDFFDFELYLKMTLTLVVISVAYFVQIIKVDNEALVVRLQIIKHKLFGKSK